LPILRLAGKASTRRRPVNSALGSTMSMLQSTVTSVILGALLLGLAHAQPEQQACRVPAFRGAASPQGADAEMHIVNTGRACAISNYGMFTERQNPAFSGQITRAPTTGTAEFKPPRAVYTPEPGFEGEDYFEYEATAKGSNESALLFRVRVKVYVKAP
jgi:hypothetical protein